MKEELVSLAGATPDSPLIICLVEEENKQPITSFFNEIKGPCHLLFLSGFSWDDDLSPYPAKQPFSKGEFAGKGPMLLKQIEEDVLTRVYKEIGGRPNKVGIAGYSLAGLFALWAFLSSPAFQGAASCSGSLWYPRFLEKIETGELQQDSGFVYLSLGDKEKFSKNPLLKTVEEKTLAIQKILENKGVKTRYESNAGNHFQDPDRRLWKGIANLLENFLI